MRIQMHEKEFTALVARALARWARADFYATDPVKGSVYYLGPGEWARGRWDDTINYSPGPSQMYVGGIVDPQDVPITAIASVLVKILRTIDKEFDQVLSEEEDKEYWEHVRANPAA